MCSLSGNVTEYYLLPTVALQGRQYYVHLMRRKGRLRKVRSVSNYPKAIPLVSSRARIQMFLNRKFHDLPLLHAVP